MASKYEPGKYRLRIKRGVDGLGLFADEPIPKGACIIEYVGRAISAAEAYTSRSKYLFEVNKKITIDGQARSNTARYINHSCRPNCEVEISKGRIFVLARRAIKTGEELNYDYGEEYMTDYIAPKGCRCVKCKPAKES
jgi:SET domain-containing protein